MIALLLFGAVRARACSCTGPSPVCSVYFGSPVIFRGTVVERTLVRPPAQTVKNLDGSTSQIMSPGTYKVRLSVSEAFRGGEGKQELTVYTAEQSSACGFPFEVGVEYVVFTYENKAGDELWTSKCSKTHALNQPGGDADVEWMRGLATAPSGGRIFGRVMLARAGPLKGAKLSLRGAVNLDVVPDEKGAYEIKGLPPGEYRISTTVPMGFWAPPERTLMVNDKGCSQVNWNVTYDGHVRGRVADVDGTPVAHLMVTLERRDGNSFNGFAMVDMKDTGEDGSYDFKWVGPGEYFVVANNLGASLTRPYPKVYYPAAETVESSAPVQVGASATVDAIEIIMPRAWKRITVKTKVVEADGTAAAGVTVYGREVKNQSSVEPMSATTGADGVATVPLYEGQEYYMTATQSGGVQQRCGGPVKFLAKDGLDLGTIRIEHPWGNCLAQLNPNFRGAR
jgi:hypothetical protein